MGQRGPPPLPTAERKARGTYDKSRDRAANVAQTTPGEPPMPSDLPPAAELRWRKLAPLLLQAGMLDERDGGALEAYCREWARWKDLQADAAEHRNVSTPYGPKANPAGMAACKLHREIIQPLELALGLHYAARSRLRKPESTGERDAVAEELFGPLTAVQGGKGE